MPIINYFEFYYHPHQSDMDFRPEFPPSELDFLRARSRNAMLLLDLENCRRGYSPTHFQQQLFPEVYRPKIDVIFDGIETDIFRRQDGCPRRVGDRVDPRVDADRDLRQPRLRGDARVRHLHEGRQADLPAVSRTSSSWSWAATGSATAATRSTSEHKTFREHVLAQADYDLSKFIFTGLLPVSKLVDLLSLSDLHLYFTVPFVLSWSMMDALACGCTVLASDTAPVREMIEDGRNGLLCGFFDVEGFAAKAVEVLRDPGAFRHLGQAAVDPHPRRLRDRRDPAAARPAVRADGRWRLVPRPANSTTVKSDGVARQDRELHLAAKTVRML